MFQSRQAGSNARYVGLIAAAIIAANGCSVAEPVIEPGTHRVIATFDNVQTETGMIWASFCTEAEYEAMGEAPCFKQGRVEATNGATITFEDVPSGVYAISAYHDDNANDRLDFDTRGIPFEPTGNSGNARGFFGPPSFDQMKFVLTGPGSEAGRQIAITLYTVSVP